MALDHAAVGREAGPTEVNWTSRDALLYALGVGAGQEDPFAELEFTTENSTNVVQRMLPTYAVLITQNASRPRLGDIEGPRLVHAEQGFELHRPLPVEGSARVTTRITGIHDKGSGALVTFEASAVDAASGQPLVTTRSAVFIRGEGGFGGTRGPAGPAPVPGRAPDFERSVATRADQALLYRLSGDRNPLHSCPAAARRGGFDRPILHGMCTYGITGRVLLHAFCGSDPARMRAMYGRFTHPVLPGDTLTVQGWSEGGIIRFRTLGPSGKPVLDHGTVELSGGAAG